MNRILTFLITLGAVAPAFAQNAPLLPDTVRQMAEARKYPSLVIGVIQGDQRKVEPFGTVGTAKPDGDTIYEIGSVTKTFTALLLADAVQHGEVTLDTPVQKLLPGFTIPKSGEHAITLLDLATQSSGLPRLPENMQPKDASNPYADYTIRDLKQFLAHYSLRRAPGQGYEYSNLGFGLLGIALSERAGMPYEQLVRKRITEPLGMKSTAITMTALNDRFAPPHDGSRWDLGVLAGAGALRSSTNDLLRYVAAHMHPSGALAKAMSEATKPLRGTEDESRKIGLAWQIETRNGHTITWHNGMTGSYASFIGFTGDRGVVVLTNSARDVTDLGFAVLVPEAAPAVRSEIGLEPAVLAQYVGTYRLTPDFELVVTTKGNQLNVRATGQATLPVFASAPDEFFYKVVDAQLTFEHGPDGSVNAVVLHQGGRDIRGTKQK